jgi:transcriptional regulator with XRE-family HTH domain
MSYLIKEIANILRAARESKRLSQRALSEKTGLTQSHISKIENGAVDLQLSNLIELSRSLDMELMLVPRKLVPAVQSLVRSGTPSPEEVQQTNQAKSAIDRIGKEAAKLQRVYTKNDEYPRIRNALKDLQSMSKVGEELKRLHTVGDELKRFRVASENIKKIDMSQAEALQFGEATKEQIHKTARELHKIRNSLAHSSSRALSDVRKVKPAYSLDEEGEDG